MNSAMARGSLMAVPPRAKSTRLATDTLHVWASAKAMEAYRLRRRERFRHGFHTRA